MRSLLGFLSIVSCLALMGVRLDIVDARAGSNCPDSTEVLERLFSWDIPADGWDIAIGTNRLVYVTDPVNDRICRYTIYGSEEMCWDSPGPLEPGQFVEPRWLAWNPNNDRLYICGQAGLPGVLVYDADGNFVFAIRTDSLSTEPGQFAGGVGPIAIDPQSGFVWIYERNNLDDVIVDRIQEFDLAGQFTGRVFNRGPDCMLQVAAQIEDMAVDSTGSVYLLDQYIGPGNMSEVHRVVPGTGCVVHWGNDGGPGHLVRGVNLAVDKDGYINVLEFSASGKFVRKYNKAGDHISKLQIGPPSESFSLALDFIRDAADPFMYVATFNPHRVLVLGTGIEPRNVLATSWVDSESFQLETNDLQKLAECPDGPQDPRDEMEGVAADGVSPLLLRLHLPEFGTVHWTLADPDNPGISEGLGSLATLDSTDTGNAINSDVELVDGEYIAFAVYTAPIDFERPSVPGDIDVGERPLEVTAVFRPDSEPDSVAIVRNLRIERPTVVFLHGFLENATDWKNFQSIKTSGDAARWGDRFIIADYSRTSGQRLESNASKLRDYLESATVSARDSRGIAAAQVDIVSHSMGGLVLRRFADAAPPDSFQFKSRFNTGKGYYHKALFLNVPHQGAPVANITVTLRDVMKNSISVARRSTARWSLKAYAIMTGADFHQLIGEAVDDMSLGSNALVALQPFVAPTHSHVGTGGSDIGFSYRMLKAAAQQKVLAFVGMVNSLTNIPELALYAGNQHDVAVLLDSQKGGLINPFHYTTASFEDGLHASSFFSDLSGNVARDWGMASVTDETFFAPSLPGGSSFTPPPALIKQVNEIIQALQNEIPEFSGVTLRLSNVPSFVASGDSFLVTVEPYSDVSTVILSYPGGALFMDSTLAGYVHTDVAFAGDFELSALALMADSTVGRSESTVITVGPQAPVTLSDISVTPSSVSIAGVGGILALRVVGNYSDGVQRELTSSSSGTIYSGFDPGVVAVSPDGVIRGSSPGSTTVTVQKGAYMQVATVSVGDAPPVNNQPHALAGGPYQICNGDGLTLDASDSFDFDGDPLTYSWDLNGDGQFGDMVGASAFYSPPYIVDERIIGLRVTDSGGASSEDYTTIQVPLSCFAGQRICAADVVANEASDLGADDAGDVYVFHNVGGTGTIVKRSGTCVFDENSTAIFDPEDLAELAVDSSGVAYVIGAPADERVLLFGPGLFGELEPLIPVFTTPYSLVTGIAVDGRGNLYGSDYDTGAQHVFIRKFDQAAPTANLLANWNLTMTAGITSAELLSVAIGPDSAIFVAVGDEVLKGVAQGGGYVLDRRWGTTGMGAGQFRGVSDVAVGPDGDVFVTDYGNHRVQRFDSNGTFRSMRKGTHVLNGKFYHPTAVTVLDSARVAVADFEFAGGPRVQVFYWGDAVPTTVPPRPTVFRDALAQNYPNPFNPSTMIRFSLAERDQVMLAIYDVRGSLVRTLVDEPRPAGEYRVEWNGENSSGVRVSSGVYFYRLIAGQFQATKKMVLLK